MQLAKPGGLDKFKLNELDIPKPKGNEILIKVNASSLNYHDLMCALGSVSYTHLTLPTTPYV